MLTLAFGNAIELDGPNDPIIGDARVRTYIVGSRAFLRVDTDDLAHVCDSQCAAELIRREFAEFTQCETDVSAYVDLSEQTDTAGAPVGQWSTIDVGDGDTGDDTYVLCAACGAELVRDDDRHIAEYGHAINTPSPSWSGDTRTVWSGVIEAENSGETISEDVARLIASQWHGGQSSPLYAFSSSGVIIDGLETEITEDIEEATETIDKLALPALLKFVREHSTQKERLF